MTGRGKNPNSLKNLKKVNKGDPSPNPAGKPPGTRDRSTILRQLLAAHVRKKSGSFQKNELTGEDKVTYEEQIDVALIKQALAGDVTALREIKDTLHGKIKDVQEIIRPDVTAAEAEKWTPEQAAKAYDASLKG